MEEEEKLNFKLEEIFGAGTNCQAMGLAEPRLVPLGSAQQPLKEHGEEFMEEEEKLNVKLEEIL